MGFFSALTGMGKRTTEPHAAAAAGSHDQQHPKQESHQQINFFSKIFGKKTEHDEEAGGHHGEHSQESHQPNNFVSKILGKKTEDDQEAGGHHDHEHKHESIIHPRKHFFARILNRLELFLRIMTLVFLVAGVVVLVVNQVQYITSSSSGSSIVSSLHFLSLVSYRYIFAAIIIAQTYIIVQIVFTLCRLVTGIQRGIIARYFDFLGDKILSYLLATGAAAAFGASIDMQSGSYSSFLNQGKTAAGLVLIAFFFSAISSIISSHSLPKHPAFL